MVQFMLKALTVILILLLGLLVVVVAVAITYMQVKDAQKTNERPESKLTFDGPSRIEMSATTARLLREDKRRYRRPYMRAKMAMSPNR